MTVCYKICRVENGKYFSEFGNNYPELNIEYKLRKYVYPPIGKLFVYLDIAEAIIHLCNRNVILKCSVSYDVEYINYSQFENVNKSEKFSEYWTTRIVRSNFSIVRSNIALVNSLFVEKVFSTEEVETLRKILQNKDFFMHSCYKVCRVKKGKYYSQYGFHFPKWDTEYTIGKYTYAPIGKLFVYLDIAEALKYDDGWALIKCDVSGSIEYVEFGEFEDFTKQDSFPEYWKTRVTKTLDTTSRSNIALVDYLMPTKVFSSEEVEALRNILT